MDFALAPDLDEIRAGVRALCERFPGEYWRELEPDRYPEEFVEALTRDGWLAVLIPEEYGGAGYSQDLVVERIYREAPLLLIGEGSNEIQQLVIARRLLERYAV